jgi:hypothetical protein
VTQSEILKNGRAEYSRTEKSYREGMLESSACENIVKCWTAQSLNYRLHSRPEMDKLFVNEGVMLLGNLNFGATCQRMFWIVGLST